MDEGEEMDVDVDLRVAVRSVVVVVVTAASEVKVSTKNCAVRLRSSTKVSRGVGTKPAAPHCRSTATLLQSPSSWTFTAPDSPLYVKYIRSIRLPIHDAAKPYIHGWAGGWREGVRWHLSRGCGCGLGVSVGDQKSGCVCGCGLKYVIRL